MSKKLREAADAKVGDMVTMEITPVDCEPNPEVPKDFQQALAASSETKKGWDKTTAIARLDWCTGLNLPNKQRRERNELLLPAINSRPASCEFVVSIPLAIYDKSFSAPE